MLKPAVLFLFVLTIFSGTLQASDFIQRDLIKSPNDEREYAYFTLKNSLDVLLISDPETDKAAAAMDVNVGSSSDPDDYQGLAHFLEHMLFLGTAKYPDPDEYQKYISSHGGHHNAFTSLENTNYFFEIHSDHLEGALDRFSQQFISPLFNADYVSREVNAVHSEFSSKIKDDGRRLYSAMKQTLASTHPYRNFSVGNLSTLKAKDEAGLRRALLTFYEKEYSANRMKLVVLGKEPLTRLADWVSERFGEIPNRNLPDKAIEQDFFEPGFLPAKLSVKAVMDKRTMMLAFPVPSSHPHRDSQPLSYLANLIGHEGAGSLLSALKEAQLVDSLSAGSQFDTEHKAVFTITMSLTPIGFEEQEQILKYVFDYIRLVEEDGIQRQYFNEQQRMLAIEFKYQEKSNPFHYVSALAKALQDTPAKRVLFDHYDLNNYRPDLYKNYLTYLRPENMLLVIHAQSIESEQTTPWFEAPYRIERLDTEKAMTRSSQQSAQLHMPEPNIFIPNSLELIKTSDIEIPEKIYSSKGIEVWYAANTSFGSPKANLFLTVRSPSTLQSARTLNQTKLMISLFKDALNEFSYPAYLAGLNYEIYDHVRGLTIKVSGYSEKQSLLLNKLLLTIKHKAFDIKRFELAKERLRRSLLNARDRKPYEQALTATQRLLLDPSWSEEERLTALEAIDLDSLESFRSEFFGKLDLMLLNTGNVTRATSLNTARQVESILLSSAKTTKVARSKVVKLKGDTAWLHTLDVDHPDTGFVYYLQGDSRTYEEQAAFMMISQLMSSDYYAEIRTNQQLGYIVFATIYNLLEVPAIAFIVQSPNSDGETLIEATRSFLGNAIVSLDNLESEAFERQRAAVIGRLEEKDNTLYQVSNRYWQELDRENYHFDTKEKLIRAVKSLNKTQLGQFLKSKLDIQGNILSVVSKSLSTDTSGESDSAFSAMIKIGAEEKAKLERFPEY